MTSCLNNKELKISEYCPLCITFNDFINEIIDYTLEIKNENSSKIKDFDLELWKNIFHHSSNNWYRNIDNVSQKRDMSVDLKIDNFKDILYNIPESIEERKSIIDKYYYQIFIEFTRQHWFQEFFTNLISILDI